MESVKEKQNTFFDKAKDQFGYTNVMQSPKVEKVIVNVGSGARRDKDHHATVMDRLAKITGQKPSPRPAKQSIASYKLREGEVVGQQVTLRGQQMIDFLDRLINIALPRTKDFRGISRSAVDEMGNYTLGIKENTIFPETGDEDLRDVFGMAVTIVTGATSKEEAIALLEHIGMPFKKVVTE
jgi:large subunit ribosomal protein L5